MRKQISGVETPARLAGLSSSDVPEMLQLMRQMAADLHLLAASAAPRPEPIAAHDAGAAELLRAIGEGHFSVAELLLRAEVVADRVEDRRLRDAIVATLGEVNGKRLGQLLRRVAKAPISDLRVARVGKKKRDGVTWRVATFEPEKVAEVIAPAAANVKRCANGTS